jgi:hypothetical protein
LGREHATRSETQTLGFLPVTTGVVQHNPPKALGQGKIWKKWEPFRDVTNTGDMKDGKKIPAHQTRHGRRQAL